MTLWLINLHVMNAKLYFIIAFIAWFLLLFYYRKSIRKEGFNVIKLLLNKSYSSINITSANMIFLAGIMLVLLFHAFQLPLSFDESYTFNNFTSKGIYHSLFKYPAPNNHVLHSLFTNISWFLLGFTHSEFAVRMPALFFSFLSVFVVFNFFLRNNVFACLFFTAVFLLSPNLIEFAFQARGYSMQIFFSLVSYYLATRLEIRGLHFKTRFIFWLFLTIMGLFTSPAYFYTAFTIGLLFGYRFFTDFKNNILFTLAMLLLFGLSLLLLYSPIILHQGLDKIISNKFVVPVEQVNWSAIAKHFIDIINFISLPLGFGWGLLAIFIFFTVKEKDYYNFFLLVTPILLMLMLKQLPFYRVFLPIGILIIVTVCYSAFQGKIIRNYFILKNIVSYVSILLALGFFSIYYFNKIHQKDDLTSSFEYKKIIPHLNKYGLLADIDNCDWYMMELISANHTLKNKPEFIRFQKGSSINGKGSFVMLNKHRVPDYKTIDSLYSLNHQIRWIQISDHPQ